MHGLLLDLRYGEFRLLVVREVRGDNEAAAEVDEFKDITVECALLPTDVDKRGDDEIGTIDAQVIGKDVIWDNETGKIGDDASIRIRLSSPIEVSSLVGIDLRLFIEAERVLITAAGASSTLTATAAGSTANAFVRIENCDMLEGVVDVKFDLRSLRSAMETIVRGLPPVVT